MRDSRLHLREHAEHEWETRGRCVYCRPCNVRLYAGGLPSAGKKAELIDALDGVLEVLRDFVRKRRKR